MACTGKRTLATVMWKRQRTTTTRTRTSTTSRRGQSCRLILALVIVFVLLLSVGPQLWWSLRFTDILVENTATLYSTTTTTTTTSANITHITNTKPNQQRSYPGIPVLSVKDPFPRWTIPNGTDERTLALLIRFIHGVIHGNETTITLPKPYQRYPEILYVVNASGVSVSRTLRYDRSTWQTNLHNRAKPTERIMKLAHQLILDDLQTKHSDQWRWPTLGKILSKSFENNSGFPFIVWYGDYKGCNQFNWKKRYSIPLFTMCAMTSNCHHSIPIPNYQTIETSKSSSHAWIHDFLPSNNHQYPFDQKIPKVVWRGSLSAPMNTTSVNLDNDNIRWRLVHLARRQDADNEYLDVGLTSIPSRHNVLLSKDPTKTTSILKAILRDPIQPMNDFQRFVGILDVDGNSWSSRFGTLLCCNSVVLKVDPDYVDYFNHKRPPMKSQPDRLSYSALQAWKHYIPIKRDLSDLLSIVRYVTSPENADSIQRIITNANDWCQQSMVHNVLAADLADIWEFYVQHVLELSLSDHQDLWTASKRDIFESTLFRMELL